MIETITSPRKDRDMFDFYATDPKCVQDLLDRENLPINSYVLENSAGNGHIAKILKNNDLKVFTIDIKKRDYELNVVTDFLTFSKPLRFDYAIYNPPFRYINDFIVKTFEFTDVQYVFARIQLLESVKRYDRIFGHNWLEKVYIYSNRVTTAKGGDDSLFGQRTSLCFCWFKFNKNNNSKPTIEWIVK